jgi:hypothetical protein
MQTHFPDFFFWRAVPSDTDTGEAVLLTVRLAATVFCSNQFASVQSFNTRSKWMLYALTLYSIVPVGQLVPFPFHSLRIQPTVLITS